MVDMKATRTYETRFYIVRVGVPVTLFEMMKGHCFCVQCLVTFTYIQQAALSSLNLDALMHTYIEQPCKYIRNTNSYQSSVN